MSFLEMSFSFKSQFINCQFGNCHYFLKCREFVCAVCASQLLAFTRLCSYNLQLQYLSFFSDQNYALQAYHDVLVTVLTISLPSNAEKLTGTPY